MCLGKNWDPKAKYVELRPTDGAKPPEIPEEFRKQVKGEIQASHDFLLHLNKDINVEDELPKMSPDICIINFYNENGRLGLHQKQDQLLLEAREKREQGVHILHKYGRAEWMAWRWMIIPCKKFSIFMMLFWVDEQEKPGKLSEPQNVSIEDNAILHSYLPLLREFLPTAAEEIESDVSSFQAKDNPLNEYLDEESSQDEEKENGPLDFLSDTDSQNANIDSDEEDED
ncbi:hypothetical protein J5N97_014725 [Dioscorea zingiberensis]|uniref:Alpha-ketoglutarate-dependent dioxygenase AlkB-like domain-containing protein n=1 Tax=Dioscorea zingiberensis TaxID=325984 RepID=A0A9D5CSY6_9LILI|nr:hypothetical protein J5N97_014725 [Dioscorea zingiberensis]